jgi:hypothetical protein
MRYRTDLEVVLLDSPGAHTALFGLFLLSLVADVVMWLPKAAFSHGVIQPNSWVAGVYLLECTIGIAALIGAALLWIAMFYLSMHDSERPLGVRVLWGLVFIFTIWWGAQLYYLFPFRQSLKRREEPGD